MDWPLQSPDLNITKCVWDYLDCVKQKTQLTSKTELTVLNGYFDRNLNRRSGQMSLDPLNYKVIQNSNMNKATSKLTLLWIVG